MNKNYAAVLLLLVSQSSFALKGDTVPLQKKNTASPVEAGSIVAPKKGAAPETKIEPEGKPTIGSVGTYGSSRINEVTLKEFLGKELDIWLAKGLASDPSAMEMEERFVTRIKKKFGFPFVEWSIVQHFDPGQLSLHLTLDVVEEKDVARRMPFSAAPKEEFTDPLGLIKAWDEYESLALDLVESGEIEPETEKCVALHCPFGHKHPKLKPYERVFQVGLKTQGPKLVEILKSDKRANFRASAAFLLAYWTDEKKKVVDAMVDRIKDPDAVVRNNALRVLGDIAEFHKETPVALAPLLPALDYPKVSDRSKALYVVHLLSLASTQVREELLKTSVPTLVSLMECKQPDHRELAHGILRKISGKEFPDSDSRAWLAWYKKLAPGAELSKK